MRENWLPGAKSSNFNSMSARHSAMRKLRIKSDKNFVAKKEERAFEITLFVDVGAKLAIFEQSRYEIDDWKKRNSAFHHGCGRKLQK
ncbi:MAG: hypothetical protein GY820_46545 [Gammaproteobacteria bacterium]|nr:hypothetical protein [Gammaproteobacteria bacterium]